ncbi:MAG: hypothetical protein O7G84_19195 [Gammaproteobacteria bacterium]|nr:hypothetical protein [Gammaproteobacteria bacterium]
MGKVKDFLLDELKTVLFVTGYFLSWFVVIGALKSLMLAEYDIDVAAMSGAIIGSLVIAKVVVILDATKAGDRFAHRRALQHILYRSAVYTFFVLLVLFSEKVVEAMLDDATLDAALEEVWAHRSRTHILTSTLLLGISLFFYNIFSVINRSLDGGLIGLLKSPMATNES